MPRPRFPPGAANRPQRHAADRPGARRGHAHRRPSGDTAVGDPRRPPPRSIPAPPTAPTPHTRPWRQTHAGERLDVLRQHIPMLLPASQAREDQRRGPGIATQSRQRALLRSVPPDIAPNYIGHRYIVNRYPTLRLARPRFRLGYGWRAFGAPLARRVRGGARRRDRLPGGVLIRRTRALLSIGRCGSPAAVALPAGLRRLLTRLVWSSPQPGWQPPSLRVPPESGRAAFCARRTPGARSAASVAIAVTRPGVGRGRLGTHARLQGADSPSFRGPPSTVATSFRSDGTRGPLGVPDPSVSARQRTDGSATTAGRRNRCFQALYRRATLRPALRHREDEQQSVPGRPRSTARTTRSRSRCSERPAARRHSSFSAPN